MRYYVEHQFMHMGPTGRQMRRDSRKLYDRSRVARTGHGSFCLAYFYSEMEAHQTCALFNGIADGGDRWAEGNSIKYSDHMKVVQARDAALHENALVFDAAKGRTVGVSLADWVAHLERRSELADERLDEIMSLQRILKASEADLLRERNVSHDQAHIIRRQREELGAQTTETDVALRARIKTVGVFPRDEWRLQTEQGLGLDKLAGEYGLLRCPGYSPPAVSATSVDALAYRLDEVEKALAVLHKWRNTKL